MARRTQSVDFTPTLDAAHRWIERCAVDDLSLFTDEPIWTTAYVGEVRRAFVERPDETGDSFSEKLQRQMADAAAPAQQLMAEMLWLALLFPSNINAATKRDAVQRIWALSGGAVAPEHPLLADSVLRGVGSGGPGYNNHRWRELVYIVDFIEALKRLPREERRIVFTDYDRFIAFTMSVPKDGHRQIRHMLRYFAFPDRVERMSSSAERRRMLQAFRGTPDKELRTWSHAQLDAALLELRRELEARHPGTDLDFYEPPLRAHWQDAKDIDVAEPEAVLVVEETANGHYSSETDAKLWAEFTAQFPDFVDFERPGQKFLDHEILYKRRGLERFAERGGRDEVARLLATGQPLEALQLIVKCCSLNFASFQSWNPSIGANRPEAAAEVLSALLDVTAQSYAGPATLEPVLAATLRHGLVPAWDTLSVLLWALRPSDYFPIKIRYYRELAAKLGCDIDPGRPDGKRFEQVMQFARKIRDIAAPRKPRDWIDVQSFLWVLCGTYPAPENEAKAQTHIAPLPSDRSQPKQRAKCIWQIAPGENARLWDEFHQTGIVAIGWDFLADLMRFDSRALIERELQAHDQSTGRRYNDAAACWDFAHAIQPGDIVIAKQGRYKLLGIGRIVSDYKHQPDRHEYHHVRQVQWMKRGVWELDAAMTVKTLTNVTPFPAWVQLVLNTMEEAGLYEELYGALPSGIGSVAPVASAAAAEEQEAEAEEFDRATALQRLFMPEQQFDTLLAQLQRKKNVILHGPPGVGKTFVAQTLAHALMGEADAGRVQMVQFHQSYGYEEFIQGLRPTPTGAFVVREGVFLSFCRRAAEDNRPWVFIVDEINRGNLSKIFGELMMLIEADKRDRRYALPLAYDDPGSPKFFVPPNVYLIGLMNTADRSLAMVDYALRRRFAFVPLKPEIGSQKFKEHLVQHKVPMTLAQAVIDAILRLNEKIRGDNADLGEGYCIGHSYFCPTSQVADPKAWLESVLEFEIKPLLEEYWMENHEQATVEVAEIRKLFA